MLTHRDFWKVLEDRNVIGMTCDVGVQVEDGEVVGLYIVGIATTAGWVDLPAPVEFDSEAVFKLVKEAQEWYDEDTDPRLNRFLASDDALDGLR